MQEEEWEEWYSELQKQIIIFSNKEIEKRKGQYVCRNCGKKMIYREVTCHIHEAYYFTKEHTSFRGKTFKFVVPQCPNKDCDNNHPHFLTLGLKEDDSNIIGPCIDY